MNRGREEDDADPSPAPTDSEPPTRVFGIGDTFRAANIAPRERKAEGRHGRRSQSKTPSRAGRYFRAVTPSGGRSFDVALDATLRAAAPYQTARGRVAGPLAIRADDLRAKLRRRKAGSTIVFIVDSSGSMGARERMTATKGAVMSLLLDAYQRRDRVALVAFRGDGAETLLPPTSSVQLARRRLERLPTGGKTPLSAGLARGLEIALVERARGSQSLPLLVVISDGKANAALDSSTDAGAEAVRIARRIRDCRIDSVAIDTEQGVVRFGRMRPLAEALGASYHRMEDLRSAGLVAAVRGSARA